MKHTPKQRNSELVDLGPAMYRCMRSKRVFHCDGMRVNVYEHTGRRAAILNFASKFGGNQVEKKVQQQQQNEREKPRFFKKKMRKCIGLG